MFKSQLLDLIAATIFLASLGLCQYLPPRRKTISLDDDQSVCSRSTACRFAVCLWERSPTFSNDTCTILDNNCYCPDSEICTRTNDYSPRNLLVTYEYRCKNPAEFFIHQGAFYVNPRARLSP